MYTFTYKDYINYLKHKEEINELKRKLDEKYKEKINNDYLKCDMVKEDTFLSKVMLIEKTRNTENLGMYLQKIVEEMNNRKDIYTEEQRELLSTIIQMILKRKIGNDLSEKLIKELNKKEDEDMLAVLEMIDKENAMIEARGVRKGARKKQIEIAKKLLKEGVNIDIIIKATGLSKEKILK